MPRILILLSLFLGLAATAVAATGVDAVAEIPFELDGNHIRLQAFLGDQPLEMLLDTGASGTVFSIAAARRLALRESSLPARAISATGSMRVALFEGPIDLRLDGETLTLARAMAMDFAHLERAGGRRLDGVLGWNLFDRYVVEIDYQQSKLRLFEPATFKPDDQAFVVPVKLDSRLPIIQASLQTLDGRRVEGTFCLDTGAAKTLVLTPRFIAQHQLLTPQTPSLKMTMYGAGRAHGHRLARLGRLQLGELALERPIAMFPDAVEDGALASDETDGVIGGGFFRRFTLTLDYRRQQVYLRPNDYFVEPERFICTGIRLETQGDTFDRFVVSEVIAGSPAAEEGILSGDRLLRVDGKPASCYRMFELNRLLGTAGREIELSFERGAGSAGAVPCKQRSTSPLATVGVGDREARARQVLDVRIEPRELL